MSGPLHWLGETLRQLFGAIPLTAVRCLFVAVPLLLMIWVLRLPPEATNPPEMRGRWADDLKVWAWLALAMQVVIYCAL